MTKLAINGGTPLYGSQLAKWPNYYPEDIGRIEDVLTSRTWGGIPFPGRYASLCIEQVKKTMGCNYASMVTNGSDALVIALKALGVLPGDEVITTGYTWVATAGAIVRCNAIPVFADIDPRTCCIDPKDVRKRITPRTKGIIVVHLANQVCDMDDIMKTAGENGLFVVEDCAHAPYSQWKGRCVGTIGDVGTFSFEQSKIITCGEGGMVVTQSAELYEKIGAYTNCGRQLGTDETFYGTFMGWNHRMTEFQAAVLYGQLLHIEEWMQKLQQNVDYLFAQIQKRCRYIRPLLAENPNVTKRQHYCVLLEYFGERIPLDLFCKAVRCEGAELEDKWYPAVNDSPLFHVFQKEWPFIEKRYSAQIGPESCELKVCREAVNNRVVWLHYPSYADSYGQIDSLIDCVVKVEENMEELMGCDRSWH